MSSRMPRTETTTCAPAGTSAVTSAATRSVTAAGRRGASMAPRVDPFDGDAELPARADVCVVGGGVIGVELGQMFARFGVRVTVVCRSRLLPGAESKEGRVVRRAAWGQTPVNEGDRIEIVRAMQGG